MWKPDRSLNKPLYQQIADHLEQRISLGELPSGSLLPAERKLSEQLGVNRSTVVQAYEELRASGLIESMKGSGTRVSPRKWGKTSRRTPNWNRYVEGGILQPSLPFMRRIREGLQSGETVINLAYGELAAELCPNDTITSLIRNEPFDQPLGYGDPQGYVPLRTALTSFLHEHRSIQATNQSILITSGSQQSLYLITQGLLSPGDAIAIENPSYCYSLPMFQSAGIRLFGMAVDEHGVIPDDILNLYTQHRIRMVFLNPNYHNPTGTVLSPERRIAILRICEQLGIPIVEDDPFSLTALDEEVPPPLKMLDQNGTVLYIGSLSKIAASGLRIGWMVAPHSVIQRLADARQQMDFGLSIFPQWIAAHFLASPELSPHLIQLRDQLRFRRDVMAQALQRQLADEVSFELPKGGLNLWCRINRPVNDYALLENGLKHGVAFVPGSVYGSESGFVRFTYARPSVHEIEPGIAQFAMALRKTME
ncbi:DNA-binding transcriptional MocR family regulator [Paenibacillus phyllosphaerae]|uniref:DNA-binding transcriptional MocR family regulator n=1 Tax=Paenibacillus phyllosphaerae TaxID=274593 RepID=A0A7W5B167_9BACL|nr:PLP-dependent aminotransferase family protein [Paenibacillus phyllosphaerae]MBB3112507.1 DNA-binding transcriptional MocR family regulator [Paenibacillus phyllosphaerae]